MYKYIISVQYLLFSIYYLLIFIMFYIIDYCYIEKHAWQYNDFDGHDTNLPRSNYYFKNF